MGSDIHGFPSTPPLSTSGSTISSPPSSCGMLNTPVNGGYFRFEGIQGVKEGCEEDVELEILANGDWARSASPEMTPSKSKQHPFLLSDPSIDIKKKEIKKKITRAIDFGLICGADEM